MPARPPTPPKDRLLHLLKTKGPQPASALAARLAVTSMAVRQHLATLFKEGLVAYRDVPGGVGRPRREWRVTEAADGRFPDSHAELAVGVIDSVRSAFGPQGMQRLLAERTRRQVSAYRARMPPPGAPLERKVAELARIRREEGYMADWGREPDGALRLVENHCPICAAARVCVGLCDGELRLFQEVLGPRVHVEREEHILAGARRCRYRIEPLRPAHTKPRSNARG
jgi:predicted ArsR family transcriptional regulator